MPKSGTNISYETLNKKYSPTPTIIQFYFSISLMELDGAPQAPVGTTST